MTSTTSSLAHLKQQGAFPSEQAAVLASIENLEKIDGKIKCLLNDGTEQMKAILTSQVVAKEFGSDLKQSYKVKVTDGILNTDGENNHILVISSLEVVATATHVAKTGVDTPTAETMKTPAPAVRKPEAIKTPVSKAQPISTLNPYIHGWSIKAKVVNKGAKRTYNSKTGVPQHVCTIEVVDEEGTSIEATFWRDAADKYFDMLEEGKVYTFSRGNVKPANKNYNRTRNDYCLHFDASSIVEECDEHIDASAMTTRMNFVAIDQLQAFVDKKTLIDLIGVVTSVGAAGSIKRKSDSSELQRRDVTIADSSMKTVSVTLWGERAESDGETLNRMLSAGQNPILAVSACRVSSYNGVTVSAGMRSTILIDPDLEEAKALRLWYESEGASATLAPAGEGLVTSSKPGTKKRYSDLASMQEQAPATTDAPPLYATVNAMLASVNPDQSLYYLACPENNRKVTEQGPGEFFCEYDGKTYPHAVRRYIATARIVDSSGILLSQIFNDQAEIIFGKQADRMHEIRESDPGLYKAALAKSTWNEWTMRIKCQAQEYNGEIRQRYAIVDVKPINYAFETRRILDQLIEAQ